jgi:hypothetical protein
MQIPPLGQEGPLNEGKATQVFLPGESRGQRSLEDYSPWGGKESDTTEPLNHFSQLLPFFEGLI